MPRILVSALAVVCAALSGAYMPAHAVGTGDFVAHPTTPAFGGSDSFGLALGDLDGDLDLDAVVANMSGQAETVWLNDGAGTFSAHPTTPSFGAGNSFGIALGDLDGDLDLDAVVANLGAQAETVWLNDGAGAFSAHPTTPSFGTGNSLGIALGDLDGDLDLDAVVANSAGQAETVWLNDGAGNFSAHPTTPSFGAGDSSGIALGDLDGDLDLDAVVANASGQAETVWLNDGAGTFSAHPTTPSFGAGDSAGIALGDLDGDLDLDAVVANHFAQAETVWLNDGSGAFSAHPTTPSFGAGDSAGIALGNLDADLDLDAVVANETGGAETVWLNNGAGTFSAHPTTPSFGAGDSLDVALGDLDGDSDPDAVVANFFGQAETVWLNSDASTPTPTPTATAIPATPTATATDTATPTETATNPPAVAACAAMPVAGCAVPNKAIVKIKNTGDPARSQLLWKWLKGTAVAGVFDDPTMATTYAVCVYRDDALIAEVNAESGSNWTALAAGFKYRHPTATNTDGLFKALVKEGSGNAKILIKAKGSSLAVPAIPLNPTTNVIVQMVKDTSSGSECWQSTFSAPYTKDAAPLFKDKSP